VELEAKERGTYYREVGIVLVAKLFFFVVVVVFLRFYLRDRA